MNTGVLESWLCSHKIDFVHYCPDENSVLRATHRFGNADTTSKWTEGPYNMFLIARAGLTRVSAHVIILEDEVDMDPEAIAEILPPEQTLGREGREAVVIRVGKKLPNYHQGRRDGSEQDGRIKYLFAEIERLKAELAAATAHPPSPA